ncbi:MAG: hypothetical protein KIS67_09275 [Verrucomicrobiae bacterium]|nr:hypothetical protein [Verrucomicrobiae bacterium]
MRRRQTISDQVWSKDVSFNSLKAWRADAAVVILRRVWAAYDNLGADVLNKVNWDAAEDELERSLTFYHSVKIQELQTGDEPFILIPETPEFETRKPAPARSAAYDFGFVMRGGDWSMIWPIEAKVLRTDRKLSGYLRDLDDKYLKCKGAPFSHEGALIGYLISGSPIVVFDGIAAHIGQLLFSPHEFAGRNHRTSTHKREVPHGKPYSKDFLCHHLVMEVRESLRNQQSLTLATR